MSAYRSEWDDPAGNVGRGAMAGFGGRVPLWTKRILIANGIVFVVLWILGTSGQQLSNWLALDPGMWWTHAPYFPFWQLLTYGFVHDLSGFSHILFNCLTFFFFGSMLERALGAKKMLTVYFGAILLGGALRALLALIPMLEGSSLSGSVVGASGGVMGVLVAAAMLFPHSKILLLFIPVPLYVGATILFLMDLLMIASTTSGTAHDVHILGALFGFAFIKFGWHRRPDLALFSLGTALAERREAHTANQTQADEARLDGLLEKINREGMSSLSKSEKDFLKRMSKRP